MQNEDIILRSGAKLHLSSAPWELVEQLFSAVKMATHGKKDDPEAGSLILASGPCMGAVRALYPWATYDGVKVYQGLFDEVKLGEKARFDSNEIKEKMIEFHLRPFFLKTYSASTEQHEAPIENQRLR
jgi:hypothetical protein